MSFWERIRRILDKWLKPKPPAPPVDPPTDPPVNGSAMAKLFEAINHERSTRSLPPYFVAEALVAAARAHADDMASHNHMDHTGSDGSSFVTRIARAGYTGQPASEIIAGDFRTEAAVTAAWMSSPGHKSAILDTRADQFGVALGVAKDGRYYWCVDFGRSVSAREGVAAIAPHLPPALVPRRDA